MPTLTAGQQRQAARAEYDAFLAACPSRRVLDRISDKRVTLILVALADGPRRYSDLSRIIAGVSQLCEITHKRHYVDGRVMWPAGVSRLVAELRVLVPAT